MKREEFKITLSLSVEQVNQLSGLTALENAFQAKRGIESHYLEIDVLSSAVADLVEAHLMKYLEERKELFLLDMDDAQSEDDGGEGNVPTRNPSPEAAPDEEPETLVAVRDASGVVREVTLDEAEEMREAAQGIYEGRPPEPLLIEDRTDAYFRLLGIADWPETPCTGDYGLSDCLAEPSEETLDFVDAFFAHEDAS